MRDLSQPLHARTPIISLPPQYGQSAPFRMVEISRYDERGPGWYWNNFSCGEHTGTHFDAPVHWVTGKDFPNNTVDAIAVGNFIAPACVIDVSERVKDNDDCRCRSLGGPTRPHSCWLLGIDAHGLVAAP